jgi:hypothetical protein
MADTAGLANQGQVACFRQEMDAEITRLQNDTIRNTHGAFYAAALVIVFSALTTILVGIEQKGIREEWREYLSIAALVTSAITSGLASWDSFFSYRRRWFDFNRAASDVRRIKRDFDFLDASKSKLDEIFREFQDVIDIADTGWTKETGHRKHR